MFQELVDYIERIGWPGLEIGSDSVRVGFKTLLERTDNNETKVHLIKPQKDNRGQITGYDDIYQKLKAIILDNTICIEPRDLFNGMLGLNCYRSINEHFGLHDKEVKFIKIRADIDEYSFSGRSLSINDALYLEILAEYKAIIKAGNSYADKVVRYKSNEFQSNFYGVPRTKVTLSSPGEFKFLIDRFNLETKKKKAAFNKYLNKEDRLELQVFSEHLIKHEVFDEDFLRRLDDYFIKERLTEIIQIGKDILEKVGSTNLKTQAAKPIVQKLKEPGKPIKQLEALWQRYFEKYLLYLIFSYQSIYPKISLNLDLDKKFPDFIGVNHYGGVDVIEIKTHLKPALTWDASHKNFAFSSDLSKTIIQTINYMDALSQNKFRRRQERNEIEKKLLDGNLYRPTGIIIISSYKKLVSSGVNPDSEEFERVKRDFTKLRNSLHNIQILTFDEIISMAENYANNFIKT